MKYMLIALVVSSFFLFSCGEDKQTFNNNLVLQVDKAGTDMDSMYARINQAIVQADYSFINLITQETTDSINKRIEEVNKIESIKDGIAFRDAAMSYLQSLVKIAASYNAYSNNNIETSDEQISEMNANVSSAENYAESELTKLISTQREFATKNNITLTD